MLPTRMRTSAGWGDACILNVSSRGLLIYSNRAAPADGQVELRHGEYLIAAHVVWRNGQRIGLAVEERLPVEEIVTLACSAGLTAVTLNGPPRERRFERINSDSRIRSRALQFGSMVLIGAVFSIMVVSLMDEAFAGPMDRIAAALDGRLAASTH